MPLFCAIFNRKIARGVLICTQLVSFLSCCSPPHSWQSSLVAASSTDPCAKAYLKGENPFKDREIVVQKEALKTTVYLNLYGTPLKGSEKGTYPLLIQIEGMQKEVDGFLLSGGQRIILPKETQKELLDALSEKKDITIQAGRYSCVIHYVGFDSNFERLK